MPLYLTELVINNYYCLMSLTLHHCPLRYIWCCNISKAWKTNKLATLHQRKRTFWGEGSLLEFSAKKLQIPLSEERVNRKDLWRPKQLEVNGVKEVSFFAAGPLKISGYSETIIPLQAFCLAWRQLWNSCSSSWLMPGVHPNPRICICCCKLKQTMTKCGFSPYSSSWVCASSLSAAESQSQKDQTMVWSSKESSKDINCLTTSPKKGNKACEGLGEYALWRATEGTGAVQSGEKEALLLSSNTWKVIAVRAGLVSSHWWQVTGWGEMASHCARGGLGWISGKTSLHKGC